MEVRQIQGSVPYRDRNVAVYRSSERLNPTGLKSQHYANPLSEGIIRKTQLLQSETIQ